MKRKSKFLTFLLSIIPGLGHIYLGLASRGIVFIVATAFVVFGGVMFMMLGIFYDPIPFLILPFIWLAAWVDGLVQADRINRQLFESQAADVDAGQFWQRLEEDLKGQNNKILAMAFSLIPGAGHMYIGLMEKGIVLMITFFLTLYLSDFLRLTLLMMFAPVLWFYSIFDIMHRVADTERKDEPTFIGDFIKEGQLTKKTGKFAGIGLIAIGVIMILNQIVLPHISVYLDYRYIEYLRTGFIAILFILGGIKLMMGGRENETIKGEGQE